MKFKIIFTCIILSITIGYTYTQSLSDNTKSNNKFKLKPISTYSQNRDIITLTRINDPVFDDRGIPKYYQSIIIIKYIMMMNDKVLDTTDFSSITSWKIISTDGNIDITKIKFETIGNDRYRINFYGNFQDKSDIKISFKNGPSKNVTIDSTVSLKHWGFGKGKALDLNIGRLANQKALYAFQYDFDINLVEYNFYNNKVIYKNILHKLSLTLTSKGAFGSDDSIRNGTQTSINFEVHPYYFLAGLIYTNEIYSSFQLETATNSSQNKIFDVLNKTCKFGMKVEVPLTNWPIFKLHSITGYTRMAMPIVLEFDYLPKGTDASGNTTYNRYDFDANWELAFSPYFLFQSEWSQSKLYNTPIGIDNKPTYWSITIAQDMDAVKQVLVFLKFIFGEDNDMKGKNFIYFKISDGSKAPAFQKKREVKFGFATYL